MNHDLLMKHVKEFQEHQDHPDHGQDESAIERKERVTYYL